MFDRSKENTNEDGSPMKISNSSSGSENTTTSSAFNFVTHLIDSQKLCREKARLQIQELLSCYSPQVDRGRSL
jgi:hypothetical protein